MSVTVTTKPTKNTWTSPDAQGPGFRPGPFLLPLFRSFGYVQMLTDISVAHILVVLHHGIDASLIESFSIGSNHSRLYGSIRLHSSGDDDIPELVRIGDAAMGVEAAL